jgi:hypothetical protein
LDAGSHESAGGDLAALRHDDDIVLRFDASFSRDR